MTYSAFTVVPNYQYITISSYLSIEQMQSQLSASTSVDDSNDKSFTQSRPSSVTTHQQTTPKPQQIPTPSPRQEPTSQGNQSNTNSKQWNDDIL